MPPLQLVNFIVNRVKVIQEAFKLKVSMKTSKRTKYAKSIFFSGETHVWRERPCPHPAPF